jgi:hypothetical protein
MQGHELLWGDTHTHFVDLEQADSILSEARENIDFTVVLLYPFTYERVNGFRVETTSNRPQFLTEWQRINELSEGHNEPGRFTTFPGYEWHGNRTAYGDHNVIYRCEGQSLDDTWSLPDLYEALRKQQALAIPHHTAYRVGARGKDWRFYDPFISPVMELYSQHGSSEAVEAPEFMAYNTSMGPGASGGTFGDALARGLRVGVIGSNDGPGLPGRWGMGRAAVWASENSREPIWRSLLARRTYAVTGDRIRLDMRVGDTLMGGELAAHGTVDVDVDVVGSQAIDKIELIHNGGTVAKYAHVGKPERGEPFPERLKVLLEAGWGPAAHNGFSLPEDGWLWNGSLRIRGGQIVDVEKCFSNLGQAVNLEDVYTCRFQLRSTARHSRHPSGLRQGMILELDVGQDLKLDLTCEGKQLQLPLRDLLSFSALVPLVDEVQSLVDQQFGLQPSDVTNPDAYYQNARKLVVHRAVPIWDYEVSHTFSSVKMAAGLNTLYVRVTQTNGQMAWSSPIWVEAGYR